MGIGDSITLVGCLAGMMLALPALMIFLNLTFTQTTLASAERLHQGFLLPLVAGAVGIAVIAFPASLLVSMGSIFQFTGVVIYLALLTWAFTGLAGLARMIGGRMMASSDRFVSPFVEMMIGAFVVTFAIAFPLIGWLFILPIGLVAGLGASILGLRGASKTNSEPMTEAA